MAKEQYNFRTMSFYQIWVRSFCDGNDDGIGDLYGVYNKLEYIRSLGVDAIWFSPIFPSPNTDFGYDISDYRAIHPDYGTMEQFEKVLDKAHSLGMKVLLDLVINHTSDEHPWFIESRKGKDNPYRDYYIWHDPKWKKKTKKEPNNWFSQFEGRAWEYIAERGQYYMHIFSKKQPDLNMENPKVREEVKDIMRFWLDKGVDGFREDVITYISKHLDFPDGIPFLPSINGLPFYSNGPRLHDYLREFRKVVQEYGAIQIGEGPYTNVNTALAYASGDDRVLDMMISFEPMCADSIKVEYVHHPFSLRKLKTAFTKWQTVLQGKAWNALYLENHDHPRVISRYGSEEFRRESGTCLAASYIFQQGCPFIYQGQEIGMTSLRLPSIYHYSDIASINFYHSFFTWQSEEKRMKRIYRASRDGARSPVQWDDSENAGFTSGTPWFPVNPNYKSINAAKEEKDPEGVLNFYRKCLQLRKSSDVLLYGDYKEYFHNSRKLYMYERSLDGSRILVICSFSKKKIHYSLPEGYKASDGKLLLTNYQYGVTDGILRPYETRVYAFEQKN